MITFWKSSKYLLFPLILLSSLGIHSYVSYHAPHQTMDEPAHYGQIMMFYRGDFEIIDTLTTIPGYHLVMAQIAQLLRFEKLYHVRLISLAFGLLSVYFFYLCIKKVSGEISTPRTLAFFTLPVLLPYQFLVYPHSLSMGCILLGSYAFLNKRYNLSAFVIGLSILSRQTDIVWVAMIATILYLEQFSLNLSWANSKKFIFRGWAFLLIFTAFLIFIAINKGIPLGDTESHPLMISVNNFFFFLIIHFILFLPMILCRAKIILLSATKKISLPKNSSLSLERFYLPVWFIALCIAAICSWKYKVTHDYNLNEIYLHNYLALFFSKNIFWKVVSFIAILISIISLFSIEFSRRSFLLLYFFSTILLLLHPLIEHRYYIPIFTFLLLFMKPFEQRWLEWLQVGYFIAINSLLIYLCFFKHFVL